MAFSVREKKVPTHEDSNLKNLENQLIKLCKKISLGLDNKKDYGAFKSVNGAFKSINGAFKSINVHCKIQYLLSVSKKQY